jgi:hypothetical protein
VYPRLKQRSRRFARLGGQINASSQLFSQSQRVVVQKTIPKPMMSTWLAKACLERLKRHLHALIDPILVRVIDLPESLVL